MAQSTSDAVRFPYRVVVTAARATEQTPPAFTSMEPLKRGAIATCRRETLHAGVGARGEVFRGLRYGEVIHHCRVGLNDAGHPKLITED